MRWPSGAGAPIFEAAQPKTDRKPIVKQRVSGKLPGLRRDAAKGQTSGIAIEYRHSPAKGTREQIVTLDANSASFTQDLTALFERNVRKARREHSRKQGVVARGGKRA
jgi:hypothetical protein